MLFLLICISIGGLYYLNLSNRHKALIKTRLNHSLGLVDNQWNIINKKNSTSYITPTFVIDNIYKSMEGPRTYNNFQLDYSRDNLVWITSFKTQVVSTNENDTLSNDYVCHTNIDYYDGEHYSRWGLDSRIGSQYPRLTSMSNGIEDYEFPKGYGFPVFTNETFLLTTQSLNHNIQNLEFSIKHKVKIGFKEHSKLMKPLMSKTIYIMLPYDKKNPFQGPTEINPNACLPVDTKNHSYVDEDGNSLSGHWVIFPGKMTSRYDVTHQLNLKDSTSLHHIAVHLHPFAETLSFRDKTIDSTLFKSIAKNYDNRIGLSDVSYFSSKEGLMLYPDHKYELVLTSNNTSGKTQDMMASMFVFLYDKEMDQLIQNYKSD